MMTRFYLFIVVTIPMVTLSALAQVPSATPLVTPTNLPAASQAPASWVLDLFQKFPKLSSILVVIGILRVVMKPTFSYLHTIFEGLNLTAWDQKETAIETSKPVKFLYFLIDYLASVKLPVQTISSQLPPTNKAS